MSINLKRKKSSELWQFFEADASFYAKCNICKTKISYRTTISNLKKHMKSKHPTVALPDNRSNIVSRFDTPLRTINYVHEIYCSQGRIM